MLNPRRIGLIETLKEMGADITIANKRDNGGETHRRSRRAPFRRCKGIDVPPERAPSMIDEYPVLAVAAAFAEGQDDACAAWKNCASRKAIASLRSPPGLKANGVNVEELARRHDRRGPGRGRRARRRRCAHPHGSPHRHELPRHGPGVASSRVRVDDGSMIATSFPQFPAADERARRRDRTGQQVSAPVVIAVDGTAACGKGTLARLLARHYGFAHLEFRRALSPRRARRDRSQRRSRQAKRTRSRPRGAIDLTRAGDPSIRTRRCRRAPPRRSPPFRRCAARCSTIQREFAAPSAAAAAAGAVIDGRDIGTVIAPDATAKLFVDARPEMRAHRRWLELQAMGITPRRRPMCVRGTRRPRRGRSKPADFAAETSR